MEPEKFFAQACVACNSQPGFGRAQKYHRDSAGSSYSILEIPGTLERHGKSLRGTTLKVSATWEDYADLSQISLNDKHGGDEKSCEALPKLPEQKGPRSMGSFLCLAPGPIFERASSPICLDAHFQNIESEAASQRISSSVSAEKQSTAHHPDEDSFYQKSRSDKRQSSFTVDPCIQHGFP